MFIILIQGDTQIMFIILIQGDTQIMFTIQIQGDTQKSNFNDYITIPFEFRLLPFIVQCGPFSLT